MKYIQQKAFPYPVLRTNSDDYTDGAFQAAVHAFIEGKEDGLCLNVSGNFLLSVEEIDHLIEKQLAQYSVIIDCRDTFTREHILTFDKSFSKVFEPGELEGEFTISTSIVATKNIIDFSSKYLHEDFKSEDIFFEEGSLLAQAEDQTHYITRDFFKPLTSIFEYKINPKIEKNMFSIDLTGDKIFITLNKDLHKATEKAKASGKYGPVIFNSFYLPCLIRVLSVMDDKEQIDSFSGKQWYKIVDQKLTDLKITRPIKDTVFVAQQLFHKPIESLVNMFNKLDKDSLE
jgi:hypothetical protein